jgi:hypothetical protein
MMDTIENPEEQLGNGRLIMLGAASAVLFISMVMSVFAPFPIALAAIIYGRKKGYGVSIIGFVLTYILAKLFKTDPSMSLFYLVNVIFAIMISEIVRRNISPMKGLFKFGMIFIFISGLLGYAAIKTSNVSVRDSIIAQFKASAVQIEEKKKEIESSGNEQAQEFLALLSDPGKLADELIVQIPNYFLISVFFTLWVNLFLLLKSARFILRENGPLYDEMKLIDLKVPEKVIYILIPALAIATWGNSITGMNIENFGKTLLWFVGVFYFFQGFGIYSKFLSKMRVFGFIRTMLVIFTVFSAYWLLAIFGVLDLFVNFDRFFVNKSKE